VVVLSVLGCLVLWARHRKPRGLTAGIDEFSRGLRALAPEQGNERESRSG
jgi:hypothetical protein